MKVRTEWVLLLLGLVACLTGCGTVGFYSQAAGGQLEVLSKRKPIDKVIRDTGDPALRERLELTKRLLDFAESELKMPSSGSYELYAEIGREHLVWVVHAAPELSLEPKRWWYPVVGRQSYRGFFREDLANAEVARLQAKGLETWVGGVDAFSTLGWFRDPVMDTFVDREEVDYVELILHELVHRKYYVSGKTDFNEAMAEAVAREGVRRWFKATSRPDLARRYDERLRRINQARKVIGGSVKRLEAIYSWEISADEKRRLKGLEINRLRSRLRELRTEWGRGLTSWIDDPINNARLNSFTTYESGVPRFVSLIEECDGDFERFWARVKELDD
jgi:predicted aminopeptidase